MPSVFTAGLHAQIFVLAVAFLLAPASPRNLLAAPAPQQTPAPAAAGTRAVGTIKSVVDTTVTLATDSGAELKIVLQPDTKILRVAPGQQDIKQATPIAASDLQTGDRILVRGKTADDAKTLLAISPWPKRTLPPSKPKTAKNGSAMASAESSTPSTLRPIPSPSASPLWAKRKMY